MKTATKLNSNHPSSPSSENSVYFDAADSPTMRFFGRKSSTTGQANDQDVNNNTTSGLASGGIAGPSWETEQPSFPEPDPGSPPGAGQVDADTQPSVTIPPDHNVNQFQPAQTNGTYNSVPEPQSGGQSASSAVPQDGGTGDSLQRNEPTSVASAAPISDSGYDSPVTNQHRRSKSTGRSGGKAPRTGQGENVDAVGQGDKEIKPIPVLWTDAAEGQANVSRMRSQRTARGEDGGGGSVRRSGSTRSSRSGYGVDRDRADQESIRTTPSMRRRRVSLSAGSFAGGAGTVGPNADADIDDSLSERRDAADAELTKKQKQRLSKVEVKEGKRLAAVIKSEARLEQRALEIAIKEMADIQKLQKASIKEEARTHSAHATAIRTYHKEELEFFAARAKYEKAQADLQAFEDSREASRQHAQEATEMLQEKNREVEWLRAQKATHDREREAKLLKLAGKA